MIANLRLKCPGVVVSLTLLTLFRKITAVAVELSSDLMSLALLGVQPAGEGGDNPYNGLHGKAPPKRDTFLRVQVYERAGISQVEA